MSHAVIVWCLRLCTIGYSIFVCQKTLCIRFACLAGPRCAGHRSKAQVDHLAQNGAVNLAAAPEPEPYAMMLAGIGLVFGIARRRRRVRA